MDVYSSEKRSEVMSKVRSSDTGPEMIVRRKLHSLGFRFRLYSKKLPGKPDIVLPKYRSVVLVHGCFWHHHTECPKSRLPASNAEFWRNKILRNVRRDEQNIAELIRLGWRVLVIWECEIKNGSYMESLNKFLQRDSVNS
jgi:DNA mismatch endonuclease (patch repair protein)